MNAETTYETAKAIAIHLNAAIDQGGANQVLHVLNDLIMAKGEAQIAARNIKCA
jgi:DNA-binding phage protein